MPRKQPSASVDVQVSYGLAKKGLPKEADFLAWAIAAVGKRRRAAEVSLRVVDEAEGRELNRQYRHKDYATNVLSFPAALPPDLGVPLLGDVILCAPVVAREAEAQGKPLAAHYAHLTVHGVLHLLGFDHETISDARTMEGLEVQILDSMGIPDPYAER
ncbi:MAG TPA: rRNA maturation RNase YbeY [Xanthomonadales bacterium]|nr:rRNA maturation RNase YbeY [Xanthomonadales bacterium]